MTADGHTAVRQAMERALGSDRVSDNVADHRVADASPGVVVFPEGIEQLSMVMAEASESGLAVAPWGGGTRTELGNAISRLDLVAELTRLDRVVQHTSADLTCTVQAGIRMSALQEVLAREGQHLALDPPLPDRATIGGTLATGTSGPAKHQFGNPRDLVLGMKVVQADGKVVKSGGQVVKNVSGYDMARLHIGGLGTLGIIAEVSFKLTPLPVGETTLVASFGSLGDAMNAGLGIMHSGMIPLAITSFDTEVNSRAGALPMPGSHFLAVRLGGRPRTLKRMIDDCSSLAEEAGAMNAETLDDATGKLLWRRIADFGWDENSAPVMAGRAAVPPSRARELIETIERSDVTDELSTAVMCHGGYGTVLMFWYAPDKGPSDEVLRDALKQARDATHAAGGTMIVERCPAVVKTGFEVWDEVGDSLSIMRRLKDQYDPNNVLNPGRFVGGL